jgi:hypothetical protein
VFKGERKLAWLGKIQLTDLEACEQIKREGMNPDRSLKKFGETNFQFLPDHVRRKPIGQQQPRTEKKGQKTQAEPDEPF